MEAAGIERGGAIEEDASSGGEGLNCVGSNRGKRTFGNAKEVHLPLRLLSARFLTTPLLGNGSFPLYIGRHKSATVIYCSAAL